MGKDKATLILGGGPLVKHVFDVVSGVFATTFVVSNHHDKINGIEAPIVPDVLPLQSPIVGIATALIHARTPYVFVVACDMPYLNKDAIIYLIEALSGQGVVVPKTNKGYEPLHAIYHRCCLSPLLTMIERGEMKVARLFRYVLTREVGEHHSFVNGEQSVFANMNTVEDLRRARSAGDR